MSTTVQSHPQQRAGCIAPVQISPRVETGIGAGGGVGGVLPVAALCVAPKSIYRSLPGVECYDRNRDVRTFAGGMPVVGHPPCRSWSAYCAHQAKPLPGEKELGPLVVEWLRKCGGVLEHPAHSRLFDACNLPKPIRGPGTWRRQGDLWSMAVEQSWWGDSRTKTTWLCFCGLTPEDIHLPMRLHEPSGDRRRWQVMSSTQRSASHPAFAEWLVDVARRSSAAGRAAGAGVGLEPPPTEKQYNVRMSDCEGGASK